MSSVTVALVTSSLTALVALVTVFLTLRNQRNLAANARVWEKRAEVYEDIILTVNSSDWSELSTEEVLNISGRNHIYGSEAIIHAFDEWWPAVFYYRLQESGVDLKNDPADIRGHTDYWRSQILRTIRKEYSRKLFTKSLPLAPSLGGPFVLPSIFASNGEEDKEGSGDDAPRKE